MQKRTLHTDRSASLNLNFCLVNNGFRVLRPQGVTLTHHFMQVYLKSGSSYKSQLNIIPENNSNPCVTPNIDC